MYSVVDKEDLQDKICLRIARGESVATISKEKDMPHEDTIYEWIKKNAHFSENYVRARLEQAEHYAIEIMDIGDDLNNNATREQIEIAKVRIESRKWIASKLLPKKYGPPQTGPTVLINTQPITGMKILDIEHEEVD